ncbi:armadillo-type protein [Powellomyces hirtus]|nr:armadillo-type protein [Powellomyces hirtus]
MSFLFKTRPKTPAELVRGTKDAVAKLDVTDRKKVTQTVCFAIASPHILYGDGGSDPVPEQVAQLSQEVYNSDLLPIMDQQHCKFEFEVRQIGTRFPTSEYIGTREEILVALIHGYENQEIALNCGMILRECIQLSTFDVASDAFATFKDLLTKHKPLVADFLTKNYDQFFEQYTQLLNSSNYVTKRQSLKVSPGRVASGSNELTIMTKYISNAENLKLMMNLLRDKSRNIQFEAFHVFKVFVANPNKHKSILDILQKNRDKLITFLSNFHNDRADDEQFNDEKAFLIKQIHDL